MSLLDMIPERDRAAVRSNLFASEEFFAAVRQAVYGLQHGAEKRLIDVHLDAAFERHGFAPSNPEHAAALAASLSEIERVAATLEKVGMPDLPLLHEVRALAGPLRSAVERLRGLK